MPAMHSPAVQCCLCVVGVLIFVLGLIITSIGICLILNFGVWENPLDIPDFDSEEGKKKVGIIFTCFGVLAMLVSISVSLMYLCKSKKAPPSIAKQPLTQPMRGENAAKKPTTGNKDKPSQRGSHSIHHENESKYSRSVPKPLRKHLRKNKITKTPRLDKITEAASRKPSEADIQLAAYDDEDRPDSQGSQSTQTKETTDSEMTSDHQDSVRRVPIIVQTTPSEDGRRSEGRNEVSDTSDTNDDDDVFAPSPPDEHGAKIGITGNAIKSENVSLASDSAHSGFGFASGPLHNGMPDIETVFQQRLIYDKPGDVKRYESAETLTIEDAGDDLEADLNVRYNTSTVPFPKQQEVESFYPNISDSPDSLSVCDNFKKGNSIAVSSKESLEKENSKEGWYLDSTSDTVDLNHSDYVISHNDDSLLLKDEKKQTVGLDNVSYQDYIPSD